MGLQLNYDKHFSTLVIYNLKSAVLVLVKHL